MLVMSVASGCTSGPGATVGEMGDAPANVRRKAALGPDPPNVFIRLYRHRPQRHVTPTENFVTEAFAIVLSLQRPILEALFQRLGEHGVPSDVRVETQVPEGDSCFDMTISNETDFYFVVECKLGAGFAKSADEIPDQLSRYAAAVSRSPALRKGVITLTVRTPPTAWSIAASSSAPLASRSTPTRKSSSCRRYLPAPLSLLPLVPKRSRSTRSDRRASR